MGSRNSIAVSDGDSYYLAIQAMGKKKWAEKGSVICNKMVDSKIFPDAEKVGKIKVLCRSDKSNDAFLVYSKAKEDGKSPPTEFIVFLINHLSRKPETIQMAIELLDSYFGESVAPFAKVITFLCITGKSSEAFLVYSKAKEEGKSLPIKVVFLINQLARKPDTIHSAFELLFLLRRITSCFCLCHSQMNSSRVPRTAIKFRGTRHEFRGTRAMDSAEAMSSRNSIAVSGEFAMGSAETISSRNSISHNCITRWKEPMAGSNVRIRYR
ncbi:hypothetical protein ZOSMA_312G00080 [Zostera marina]|uniref:Uncharacterized protein n=1 Tax=Zostera marina TaxID=29655 RepID=A0A0K9PBX7_ZOSMR|nr:hypothetical protein ZOSMA_312G00080 [Zostera marina]